MLKLDMEIFEDLSFYCQSKSTGLTPVKMFQNVADELNTPDFEKAPFDYIRHSSNVTDFLDVTTSAEDPFTFKVKSGISSIDNVNIENNLLQEPLMEGESRDNISLSNMDEPTENYLCRGINSNSSNMFYPCKEEIYYNTTSDRVTPLTTALIDEDDEYLPTVGNCSEIYIQNSNSSDDVFIPSESNNEYVILQPQYETPDSSRNSTEFSETNSTLLKLQIDQPFKCEDVSTPQIIDTLTSFDTEKFIFDDPHFNIFNFISEKDVSTPEPVLPIKHEPAQSPLPHIRKHRYKNDSDDEDYVPPSIKRRKATRVINDQGLIVESTPRRGRPPKQVEDSPVEDLTVDFSGRYREMRDKNNEASRKSRLKRKLKERGLEGEADILYERNIKLKAQVQELEKTVSNFRTNLMQLLLKK